MKRWGVWEQNLNRDAKTGQKDRPTRWLEWAMTEWQSDSNTYRDRFFEAEKGKTTGAVRYQCCNPFSCWCFGVLLLNKSRWLMQKTSPQCHTAVHHMYTCSLLSWKRRRLSATVSSSAWCQMDFIMMSRCLPPPDECSLQVTEKHSGAPKRWMVSTMFEHVVPLSRLDWTTVGSVSSKCAGTVGKAVSNGLKGDECDRLCLS